jgi:ABC-2 type transport system permease protein
VTDDTPLRGTEVVRLVAGREIAERLRAKSFFIGTGLLVAVVLAIGVVSRLVDDDGPGAVEVGFVGSASEEIAAVIEATAGAVDRDASVTSFDDAGTARAALDDGDVDVAILAADRQVAFGGDIDEPILAIVQQAWSIVETERALADAGLSAGQIAEALSVAPLDAVTLDGDTDGNGLAVLTGTLTAILLFISLQTYGTYVLTGVVEEKSTAVVEVLLVRADAGQLLAGKVIGIGVAALAQFAVGVAAGMVSLGISGVDVPGEVWSALPVTLVWFLGGFALYATLFALAGSLVSRQEDAQAAAAPIMYALVGAYLLVFVFGYVPESTASTVLSLLPPIAPLLMPMRMAAGAASVVEIVVALVLLLGATLAAWKLAGRIYEQVLLRRGSRISWRDALALLRSG